MDLSDLSTFSVQLASVMSRNDTTTYVPYASSSSSSSSSMMLSMAELLPSDFVYEGVDKTSDGTDSNAGSKRKTESRDLENGGREGAESRRREDGPSATKRAKKMYVGCAYTNQFLIENGVKPADLEQSRARAITAMNPTKTAGMVVEEEEEEKEEEEKERGRGEGKDGKKVGAHRAASASGAQMLVPTEDLGLFIDAHHRSFLGHTLGVVDNTVQLLTDTMEALDISRNAAARWSKGVDEYGVNGCDFEPVIDIKECFENEFDKKKRKLVMKRISDLDEAKLGLQDRFTDRYVSDHISCYYSVLKSYVGGEPLTSAFAAAAAAAISSQAQQQQQQHSHPHQRIPDIEKIVSAWDLINAVFTPRTTQQTTTFIDNTLRYFEQRLTRYVESRVPNSLALERLAHKNFGFLDKVDAFLTATITTTTTNCGGKASVWAKVYFCLMCGRGDLAVKAASGNPLENAVIAFVRGVPGKRRAGATEAYVESNKSAPSEDLYYTAVLALVASKILMMRSEDAETVDTTLESLFRSLDTTRFSPYIVFRYYVQLQRFKEAVEFLWRSGSVHMKIDALHLGLAMSSVSGERAALSVGDAEKLRGLRLEVLPKMTESYVAEFCLPDKEMAALYLSTEDSSALNKYAILFDSSPDYQTIISLLTKTHSRCCITNKNSCANTVTTMPGTLRRELLSVARSFEERGKHLKAAYLYHSMGAQAEAVRVLCSLLGGGIVQGPSNSPERAALLKFAGPLAEKTSNATLTALIKVAAFFDAYGARDWAKALGILEGLDLLPVAPPFKCEECARRVGAVAPPELQRCIPALMEAAMVCFRESWAKLKRSGLSSEKVATLAKTAAVEADARRLAKKAAAIVTFSALLPIVVPPETCAFIVKVQAEMS